MRNFKNNQEVIDYMRRTNSTAAMVNAPGHSSHGFVVSIYKPPIWGAESPCVVALLLCREVSRDVHLKAPLLRPLIEDYQFADEVPTSSQEDEDDPEDVVNHPSHYQDVVPGIEAIEVTRHFSFNLGNAIKYIWRAGHKDPDKFEEDLRKAIFYLEDEIGRRAQCD